MAIEITTPALPRKWHRKLIVNATGYLFISPWLIGFFVFTFGAMAVSLFLSFNKYDYITQIKWMGFGNYIRIFTKDYHFWNSVAVTFKYVFIREPLKIMLALGLALLLSQNIRGNSFYRTMIYLPSVVGMGVAVSVMWKMILAKEGFFNVILALFGIQGKAWLADPNYAFYFLVFISLFGFGGAMIIFIAGLKGIPAVLYEAAQIDGAGMLRKFRHITLPMLSPVIFFNVVMGIINGFQTFTMAFVMTGGGPLRTTSFYMLNLYSQAFENSAAGYASSLAWILFLIIMLFTLLVFRSSDMWVFYETAVRGTGNKAKREA